MFVVSPNTGYNATFVAGLLTKLPYDPANNKSTSLMSASTNSEDDITTEELERDYCHQ